MPIDKACPRTKNDFCAALEELRLARLHLREMLGIITSQTGFILTTFQGWREEISLGEARPTLNTI